MNNFNFSELNFENVGQWPDFVKYAMACLLAIGLLFLGYWLIIKSTLAEYSDLQEQEVALRLDFESKQQLAANLSAYKAQLKLMNDRFGALLKQLPAQNEMANLLEDISKTGITSGLTFELFQPEAEVTHDFYVELPINIVVLGSYQQLAIFISRITQMNRIVTWHDFEIAVLAHDKQTASADVLEMKITAKIYRYKT